MNEDKLLRYSIQLAMLSQLRNKKMITDREYDRIALKLKQDYGIVSDLFT